MNKKGSVADMFIFIALGVGVLLILGLFLYGFQVIDSNMGEFSTDNVGGDQYGSFGNISNQTVGVVVDSFEPGFHLVAFAFIFGMILSIFITGFFVRAHPVFLVIYIFIVIIAIIVSIPVSNFYETQLTGQVYSDTLAGFTAGNFIMVNLPLWVAIVGLAGVIFLFIFIRTAPTDLGSPI